MALASTKHRDTIKSFLENKDTYGTVLLSIVLDNYGAEVLEWDTSTLIKELEEDFNAVIPQVNFDKLYAMITAVSTDSFYQDWVAFGAICTALDSDRFDKDILDIPSPEQMSWGITEVHLNEDPSAMPLFSDDVKKFQGVALEFFGMARKPDIMKDAILPKGVDGGIESLKDDKFMYLGFYNKNQDDISFINKYVKSNLTELIKQLDGVPLENRDPDSWEAFKERAKSFLFS